METADFDVLVTAEEAWPAFERAVLNARSELVAGFRLFDLSTRLRSAEALAIGKDWFDLLADAVARGVSITIIVSDFDPVMATPLHEQAWRTVRQGAALAEVCGAKPGQVRIRASMHPARAGLLPWLGFLPAVLQRKWNALNKIDGVRLSRQAVGLRPGDIPQMYAVTHHQKIAVIDGETLYVGGLDLNERRFDTKDHDRPAHLTWSDVQVILRGPKAQDARRHLLSFEQVTAGKLPAPECPGIRRTLSTPRRFQMPFLSPRTCLSEIEEAHVAAFDAARRVIYIETQYLRSSAITNALIAAGERTPDLRVIVVLPALPEVLAFEDQDGLDARYGLSLQRSAVHALSHAFGERITFASPVQPRFAAREGRAVLSGSPIIYVHSKVLICDDDYGIVGSANLNGRSLRWDTEVAIEITEKAHVDILRKKVLGHWWTDDLPAEALDPGSMQPWWQREIRRNGVKSPPNRSGFLVPHDLDRLADMAQALPGVTEDIV